MADKREIERSEDGQVAMDLFTADVLAELFRTTKNTEYEELIRARQSQRGGESSGEGSGHFDQT